MHRSKTLRTGHRAGLGPALALTGAIATLLAGCSFYTKCQTDADCDNDAGIPAYCPLPGGPCLPVEQDATVPDPDVGDCVVREETCNGEDDDCDGTVDELGRACAIGDAPACAEDGIEICGDDGMPRCVPTERVGTPEAPMGCTPSDLDDCNCNGLDDDCDGMTDEGVGAPLAEVQAGVCMDSTQVCARDDEGQRVWREPDVDDILHAERPETSCDNRDNDCDGRVDELTDADGNPLPWPDAGLEGVCRDLTQICVDGDLRTPTADDIESDPPMGWERYELTCDGMDNDCDGRVDEPPRGDEPASALTGIGEPCDTQEPGVCSAGVTICDGAPRCMQETMSSDEQCNGLDDDCDDATDEGVMPEMPTCQTGELGVCAAGTPECRGVDGWACVRDTEPSTETCNGVDDDCDGTNDNDLDPAAAPDHDLGTEGVCAGIKQTCVDGAYTSQPINSYEANDASCNGTDNDCDGGFDEGAPVIACGEGQVLGDAAPLGEENRSECRRGEQTCPGVEGQGYGPCEGAVNPAGGETCHNGRDDDCDGWTDEGCLGGPCRLDGCSAGNDCREPVPCPEPPEHTTRRCFDGPNGRCGFGPESGVENDDDVPGCGCRACRTAVALGSPIDSPTCLRCLARLEACEAGEPAGLCGADGNNADDVCLRPCNGDAQCRPGWACTAVNGWKSYYLTIERDDVQRQNIAAETQFCLPLPAQ